MHVDPRAMLPDVDEFEEIPIQPSFFARLFEQGLVSARRARGHHHPVQVLLGDLLFDRRQPFLRTCVKVILYVNHIGEASGILHHLWDAHHSPYIVATMTDKNSNPCLRHSIAFYS
jgi:hypothetical protein